MDRNSKEKGKQVRQSPPYIPARCTVLHCLKPSLQFSQECADATEPISTSPDTNCDHFAPSWKLAWAPSHISNFVFVHWISAEFSIYFHITSHDFFMMIVLFCSASDVILLRFSSRLLALHFLQTSVGTTLGTSCTFSMK